VPWVSLTVGFVALVAAWFGGNFYFAAGARFGPDAAKRLGKGDMSSRTGLHDSPGELGQLAKVFDGMAESLQQRVKERELAEKTLPQSRGCNKQSSPRSDNFALTNSDLDALLNQAVMLAGQTPRSGILRRF